MGIEDHQVSSRYLEMLDAAKDYFTALNSDVARDEGYKPEEIERLKRKLEKLKNKYPSNPAYLAFLELKTELPE